MENCSPLTSMRAASCNGASGAANSGPSVLLGRSRVTLSRLWCYAGIRQVLPGAQSRRCPEAHHEANRCNLGHVTPKTLQKTLYVGFFQIGRPLQVVCLGRSQFPIPEVRLAGQAGPIYGLTTCGCGEVHRLADRLLLILLGSAHGIVNEVSVSQQLARRDRQCLHAGNNPERDNAAQAPAPLGANLPVEPFQRSAPGTPELEYAASRAPRYSVKRLVGLAAPLQAHTQCFSPVLLVVALAAPGYRTHVIA